MRKYLLFVSGLLLSSPLLLAQNAPDPAQPADPATPAEEGDPADPATPATPADPAKKKDGTKKGKAKGKADFAAFDANGDGKLSRDEVKGDSSIKFNELDRDSDGNVSRSEFESGIKATTPKAPEQPKP